MRVRMIAERALSYAPHHVATALGFFADEGLDVETDYASGPGGSGLADRLADGTADIARGGIWIPLLYRRPLEDLRLFALLCDRNPQVLLARPATGNIALADLEGRRVLLPAAATSQWMFLEGLLQESSVAYHKIQFIRDLEATTMTRLWRAGFGDFYLTSPPLSEQLIEDGFEVAVSLADVGGRVPWSVYYARADFLSSSASTSAGFAKALLRAQRWVGDHTGESIAHLIRSDFPEWSHGILAKAIDRMKKDRVWAQQVRIPARSLRRYQRIITQYGLVDRPLAYSDLVDDTAALAARSTARAAAEQPA